MISVEGGRTHFFMKLPSLLAGVFLLLTGHIAKAVSESHATDLRPFTSDPKPGPSSAQVLANLGPPDAKLGPLVWIDWKFGPKRDCPETDTLVIAFKERLRTDGENHRRTGHAAVARASSGEDCENRHRRHRTGKALK